MADSTKYIPVNGRNLVSDLKLKTLFSFRTKKTKAFVYAFVSIFVAVTFFLAFNPSPDPSSPWFSNIFITSTTIKANGTTSSSSKFSNIYSYFFPSNSSGITQSGNDTIPRSQTVNLNEPSVINNQSISQNHTQINAQQETNHTAIIMPKLAKNESVTENGVKSSSKPQDSVPVKLGTGGPSQRIEEKNRGNNVSSVSEKKQGNEDGKKQGIKDLLKKLVNCDMFDGEWVRDESYPLYKPGSCSLIDEQFNCFSNGRPDLGFQQYKWKPKACTLPRLDGSIMLQLLRGKRLVFVGDSLNRNMWESLICILRNSVKDQTKVYEASGRHNFRSEPSYAFIFKDYNCTVEFYVAPFLVQEWEAKDKNGTKKETLRLDLISNSAYQYKTADVVVFNTGHWWTHEKTSKGEDYYQEGGHIYSELNVLEAFRKAMTTWGMWVDANINPTKTSVFFRGYSASHFSGGQWNSGGACDHEIEPITNTTYLTPYPDKMTVLENVFKGMKTRVSYLNITRLTDFRKDGHPSIYRKQHYTEEEMKSPLHFQDCSHWCLPGVPDAWNEILYAQLLVKKYQSQQPL
ncbi:protein trichome birefringence-like [Rutidosis leptorrhynchoides]|uniref:protein trichome birefringence-like n=1 Tax=Rutidosis leptorrhynchoides TaxID=125765 RepID=UPI003A9989A7